jgi:hypothetical protein
MFDPNRLSIKLVWYLGYMLAIMWRKHPSSRQMALAPRCGMNGQYTCLHQSTKTLGLGGVVVVNMVLTSWRNLFFFLNENDACARKDWTLFEQFSGSRQVEKAFS